jgi:hypothetical protein
MNDPNLDRREGESPLRHHKRLVYGKLVDKTLADYDYAELSQHVYGKEYATDVSRRMMYGSKRTLELLDEEQLAGYARRLYPDQAPPRANRDTEKEAVLVFRRGA